MHLSILSLSLKWIIWLIAGGLLLLVAVALILSNILTKKTTLLMTSKDIAVAAVCVALSYALSFLGFKISSTGGTITIASMAPIGIYFYYAGFKRSLIAAYTYSILQLIVGSVYYPVQAVLDYILAYSAYALIGLFAAGTKKRALGFIIGFTLVTLIRYALHVLSGVVFFAEYAPVGQSALVYSLGYNTFLFVDFAIAMVAALALLIHPEVRSMLSRLMSKRKKPEEQATAAESAE